MKKFNYILITSFVILISFFILKKNIKKPEYYVAGYVSAQPRMAEELSSYSHIFFALYASEQDKMPFGASRQVINHNFSRGSFHFILNKENFFVMRKGEKFPETFKLKVTLSKSDKVTLDPSEKISDSKTNLKLGSTQINFNF